MPQHTLRLFLQDVKACKDIVLCILFFILFLFLFFLFLPWPFMHEQSTATHCNTLQHSATQCNTWRPLTRERSRDRKSSVVLTASTFLSCCIWSVLRHINESCHTYQRVTSHIWMGHVTHMKEECDTCEIVMWQTWLGQVTQMHESCHTFICVMSLVWTSRLTRRIKSGHTYDWVTSHIRSHVWLSHVTHQVTRMTESRLTYESRHTYVKSMSGVTRNTRSWETRHVRSNLYMSMKEPLHVNES